MTCKIFQKNTCPKSKFVSRHYGHIKLKDNKITLFGVYIITWKIFQKST